MKHHSSVNFLSNFDKQNVSEFRRQLFFIEYHKWWVWYIWGQKWVWPQKPTKKLVNIGSTNILKSSFKVFSIQKENHQ